MSDLAVCIKPLTCGNYLLFSVTQWRPLAVY